MAAVIGRIAVAEPAPLEIGTERSTSSVTAVTAPGIRAQYRGCGAFTATDTVPVSVLVDGRLLAARAAAAGAGAADGNAASAGDAAAALARAFLEQGPALFGTLDGEFALTVIDHRTDAVYLVRDRVGMRPMFWTRASNGEVLWASECKMLLPLLSRRRLDATGLAEVLVFRWLAGDRTLYHGITRLLPGSYVLLERHGGSVRATTQLYWRFETQPEPADRPMSHWVDQADAALAQAMSRRVAGAGKVAVLLSGGVDSPILAQQVRRAATDFAMISPTWEGFNDPEIPRAVEYGRLIGGDHRVVVMAQDSVEDEFVRLNRRFEQPARSPHALTLARIRTELDGFDVLVHGEGADVMFGADGLRMIRSFMAKRRWLDWCHPVPRLIGCMIPESAARLRALRTLLTRTTWDRVRMFGDSEHEPWLMRYWAARGLRLEANAAMLEHFVLHGQGMLARRQYAGLYTAAQDHMEMMDRLYARSSLHVTAPFLSPEIIDVGRRLPWEYKLDPAGRAKPVMKALSGRYFPPEMAHAPKLGFPAPTLTWLQGQLRERVRRLQAGLTPSAELFGGDLVRRLTLPADMQAVWTLICLDEIMQLFSVEPVADAD